MALHVQLYNMHEIPSQQNIIRLYVKRGPALTPLKFKIHVAINQTDPCTYLNTQIASCELISQYYHYTYTNKLHKLQTSLFQIC